MRTFNNYFIIFIKKIRRILKVLIAHDTDNWLKQCTFPILPTLAVLNTLPGKMYAGENKPSHDSIAADKCVYYISSNDPCY